MKRSVAQSTWRSVEAIPRQAELISQRSSGEVRVDGELFARNGEFVV